ncbi:MAG: hypothetical protein Q8918_15700 [Bacteroidota bacterium]|nr:hypothetical protein [Bacteroidota bacterium]
MKSKIRIRLAGKMVDGGWNMVDGGWRMVYGGWYMVDGGWTGRSGVKIKFHFYQIVLYYSAFKIAKAHPPSTIYHPRYAYTIHLSSSSPHNLSCALSQRSGTSLLLASR